MDLGSPRADTLAVEIAVPLTWEVDSAIDPEKRQALRDVLKKYKITLAKEEIWKKLALYTAGLLRADDKVSRELVQLIICLVGNLMSVKDVHDYSLCQAEDQLVQSLLKSHMFDLMDSISSSLSESQKFKTCDSVLLSIYHGLYADKSLEGIFEPAKGPKLKVTPSNCVLREFMEIVVSIVIFD